MGAQNSHIPKRLAFYATPPHDCSYLPDRDAITVFLDPKYPKNPAIYSALSQHGFRRSGDHIYRPECEHCRACTATRVDVRQFQPNRSQRRNWTLNQDVRVESRQGCFSDEHFQLYRNYLSGRHKGSNMDNPSERQFREFLLSSWSDTCFMEFRLADRLVAVAVTDRLQDGLSAVYSYYDPALVKRALGVYSVLWQLRQADRLGLAWLYLGYYIEDSAKMRYKRHYRPQQHFYSGQWQYSDS